MSNIMILYNIILSFLVFLIRFCLISVSLPHSLSHSSAMPIPKCRRLPPNYYSPKP